MGESSPLVVAVVLNWNNYEDTAECLDSLEGLSYPNVETVVVDNGSEDGSGERIEATYPTVDVLFNDENLGFSLGMNRGIEAALNRDPAFVWLLNNDLFVRDELTLGDLVARFDNRPELGAVSPLVYAYPETDDVWFWRGVVDWRRGYAYHEAPPTDPSGRGLVDSDYVPICSALFRASVFDEVGLLPAGYFIYYEDVDFAVRLTDAGYRVATDTDTSVFHRRWGSSGSHLGPTYSYYGTRNAIRFARTYHDRLGPLYPLWHLAALVKKLGHRIVRPNLPGIVGLLRGVWDGIGQTEGRGPYP